MAWPLRTKSSTEVEFVIGRTIRSDDLLYYPRPAIEHALKFGMTHSPNVVLYGPSHQGKTTLLARHLAPADSIIIECRPDFKRMQIYRVILATGGSETLAG